MYGLKAITQTPTIMNKSGRLTALLALLAPLCGCAGLPSLSELTADKVHLMEPEPSKAFCGDGSPYSFLVRRGTGANENRVLIDFGGGGACWDERCLETESTMFQSSTSGFWKMLQGVTTDGVQSVFNVLSAGASPPISFTTTVSDVKTWTYVFVPYCTQDIHLGSCKTTYVTTSGESRTVFHNGAANVRSVMDWVYSNFARPASLAFIGCSAGASAVVFTEAARASTNYGAGTNIVAVGDSPSNIVTEKFVKEGLVMW